MAGHQGQIAVVVGGACTQAVSVVADSVEVDSVEVDSVAAVFGAEDRRWGMIT